MENKNVIVNSALDSVCDVINKIFEINSGVTNIGEKTKEEHINAVKESEMEQEQACVCGACVTCTNAIDASTPVHIVKAGSSVDISGLSELNKKDIEMDKPFSGCLKTEDRLCNVKKTDIHGGEWKDVDTGSSQGENKETLKSKSSYMICTKGYGMIYFTDAGQTVKNYTNELSVFVDVLQKQFGFDRRTAGIMAEVYVKIQDVYAEKEPKERDWYFTRAISQFGGYDSKAADLLVTEIETNAWRNGAGWVYEYGESEDYFCNTVAPLSA